jgi:hypothetical protein
VVLSGVEQIINNKEAIGRVAAWDMDLQPHGLTYHTPSSIKDLVNFLPEWVEQQNLPFSGKVG